MMFLTLVEGPKDRDALVGIADNVLALRTNRVSLKQRDMIQALTSKVILLFDNDIHGVEGNGKD